MKRTTLKLLQAHLVIVKEYLEEIEMLNMHRNIQSAVHHANVCIALSKQLEKENENGYC